jgi:hypothetical protein
MAYRDVSESLRAYRDRVAHDLEEARRAAKEAAAQASRAGVLEKELAETEGLLAKVGGNRRGLPLLDDVSIAAPCKASWDEMVGDDHVRFCGQCEKNVYNLSSLPREEAEALLVAREGKMCVRLYKRVDGTVLTNDCPVGVKKRRRRRAAIAAVGGGMMAAAAALGARESAHTMGSAMPATMGSAVVMTGEVAPPLPTTTAVPTQGQWTAGGLHPPPTTEQWLLGRPPPKEPKAQKPPTDKGPMMGKMVMTR